MFRRKSLRKLLYRTYYCYFIIVILRYQQNNTWQQFAMDSRMAVNVRKNRHRYKLNGIRQFVQVIYQVNFSLFVFYSFSIFKTVYFFLMTICCIQHNAAVTIIHIMYNLLSYLTHSYHENNKTYFFNGYPVPKYTTSMIVERISLNICAFLSHSSAITVQGSLLKVYTLVNRDIYIFLCYGYLVPNEGQCQVISVLHSLKPHAGSYVTAAGPTPFYHHVFIGVHNVPVTQVNPSNNLRITAYLMAPMSRLTAIPIPPGKLSALTGSGNECSRLRSDASAGNQIGCRRYHDRCTTNSC